MDYDVSIRRFNQIPLFFHNLYKARNLQLNQLIVLLNCCQKLEKKQNRLYKNVGKPFGLMQNIPRDVKIYQIKAKLLGTIEGYSERFVRIVIDESCKLAQRLLQVVKWGKLLFGWGSKSCFRCIGPALFIIFRCFFKETSVQGLQQRCQLSIVVNAECQISGKAKIVLQSALSLGVLQKAYGF